jgi:cytochrome c peroxidase
VSARLVHALAGRLLRASAAAALVAAVSASVAGAVGVDPNPTPDPIPIPSLRLRALAKTASLKSVLLLMPPNYADFVVDAGALQVLGKALFWDAQLGSDGQACASCHFHAGADNRSRNQLNPGFRNRSQAFPSGDDAFGNSPLAPASTPPFRANYRLSMADFPLHRLADPEDARSALLSDTNDVVSSQGVFAATFQALGLPSDQGRSALSGPFSLGNALVRNTAPRNTPSAINAVFNRRNFWDSRARDEFNGANPIGSLDPTARVVQVTAGAAALTPVSIPRASAASQAVGPPLSDLEMSFSGRRFAELGRKMLGAQPLAQQVVALDDSLLGPYSAQGAGPGVKGLTVRYVDLVAQAFAPAWWDAAGWRVDLSGADPVLVQTTATGPNLFTVLEYNFPLYFGLAVDAYERTLRADDTPFDRFLEGDETALDGAQQNGLEWFLGVARCIRCHSGPELTNNGVTNVDAAKARTADLLDPPNIERMIMGDGGIATYDAGFYNIGVRPTSEDLGLGDTIGPLNQPLSHAAGYQACVRREVDALVGAGTGISADDATRAANVTCGVPHIQARPLEAIALLLQASNLLDGNTSDAAVLLSEAGGLLAGPPFEIGSPVIANFILGNSILAQARDELAARPDLTPQAAQLVANATRLMADPIDPGPDPTKAFGPPLGPNERLAVTGSFKVPGLRNVELTAPYFHNGGQATLDQVVAFYDRGGDFHDENVANADVDVRPLGLTARQRDEIVAFLHALTDDRVRFERAPFDHPSLDVPNGGTPGHAPLSFTGVPLLDDRVQIPAVGAAGHDLPLGTPGTPLANFPEPLTCALSLAAGDGQTAAAGADLPTPLSVRVTDDAGTPIAGATVLFAAPAGAAVRDASVVTDDTGLATTVATLSGSAGAQTFEARTAWAAMPPVTFTAFATSKAAAPAADRPGSSGCSSGGAGAPALLAVSFLFARLRSSRRRDGSRS